MSMLRRGERILTLSVWAYLLGGLVCGIVRAQLAATIGFRNRIPGTLDAPVFDLDGSTRLAGAAFLAQLYAGPEAASLVPVGTPRPFQTGAGAGYWEAEIVSVPFAVPGQAVWVQVVAREMVPTLPFPQAGLLGVSQVVRVVTGDSPAVLVGLASFRLEPERLSVEGQADHVLIRWLHSGASMYLLEAASRLEAPANWESVFVHSGLAGFGEMVTVTNVAAGPQAFFRLQRWR